ANHNAVDLQAAISRQRLITAEDLLQGQRGQTVVLEIFGPVRHATSLRKIRRGRKTALSFYFSRHTPQAKTRTTPFVTHGRGQALRFCLLFVRRLRLSSGTLSRKRRPQSNSSTRAGGVAGALRAGFATLSRNVGLTASKRSVSSCSVPRAMFTSST